MPHDHKDPVFGSIDCDSFSFGALAADSTNRFLLKTASGREQGVYLKKVMAAVSVSGLVASENTLLWGLALGLSTQEITDFIRANPNGKANALASAQSLYKCKVVGAIFPDRNQEGNINSTADMLLVDVKFPRWYCPEGSGMNIWVHNCGSDALGSGLDFRFAVDIRASWGTD